jgi:hypothetical protein
MADPADLFKAWQDAIREVGGVAASLVSAPAGLAGDLLGPLQRQAELLEQVLQRQIDFERALAPARAALDLVDQAASTMRAQATAFRAASLSFGQAAELLEQQAEIIERAGGTLRDPVAALRSAQDAVRGERDKR